MKDLRRRLFTDSLAELHPQYDADVALLKRPFRSSGYHTTLTGGMVHPFRDSLSYALALLDDAADREAAAGGRAGGMAEPYDPADLIRRAEAVIGAVLAHQDTAPTNRTYGIWPYHYEEPLSQMDPPDWNWADFLGKVLLAVALRHRDRLEEATARAVDQAVYHAAQSIRRRNMGPHYTNIAIMGTYVTLVYAEQYQDTDMFSYARDRLQRFVGYTRQNKAFTEYNSPTYTLLAAYDIGRMRRDVRDPEARELIDDIHRIAWKSIAEHYHPGTRQWAGPHARSYRNIQPPEFYTVLYLASDGAVAGIDPSEMRLSTDAYQVPLECPEDYIGTMVTARPRQLRDYFVKIDPTRVATTYLADDHTLGSFFASHYWNQARPVIAYWNTAAGRGGGEEAAAGEGFEGERTRTEGPSAPACFTARFLHDGYDFASALSINLQERDRLLGAVTFATDNGDTHHILDPLQEGGVEAEDLRLRLAVEEEASAAQLLFEGDGVRFTDGAVSIGVRVLYAAFGEAVRGLEPVGDDQAAGYDAADTVPAVAAPAQPEGPAVDLVLYRGPRRRFDFREMQNAVVGFALQLVGADRADADHAASRDLGEHLAHAATAELAGDDLVLSFCDTAVSMQLSVPRHPGPWRRIYDAARGTINGRDV